LNRWFDAVPNDTFVAVQTSPDLVIGVPRPQLLCVPRTYREFQLEPAGRYFWMNCAYRVAPVPEATSPTRSTVMPR
jgi:hypothetical protein